MRMCERKVWRGIYWAVDIHRTLHFVVCVSIEAWKDINQCIGIGYPGKEDCWLFFLYICVIWLFA